MDKGLYNMISYIHIIYENASEEYRKFKRRKTM